MIINLILTVLMGTTGVILWDKWKIDNFMSVRGVRFWPRNPCWLCRAFWIGAICYGVLFFVPQSIYFFVPFAAIPLQIIVSKLCTS